MYKNDANYFNYNSCSKEWKLSNLSSGGKPSPIAALERMFGGQWCCF